MKILVTGGYGFIGSNLLLSLLGTRRDALIINIDAMTYAARPKYVLDVVNGHRINYVEEIIDIRDQEQVDRAFEFYKPDHVIHLAAESHVCNSIRSPRLFYDTNVMGTVNLLMAFKKHGNGGRFLHMSTDEVFGELPLSDMSAKFTNDSPLSPRSPYASSKAAAEQAVQAFHHTYGMDTVIVNCTNNFGPNQHMEKLIPMVIKKTLTNQPVTIHGKGDHVRDWLFVGDCCKGIMTAFDKGISGERYLTGGNDERTNIETIGAVVNHMFNEYNIWNSGVEYNNDRPTDDTRYAVDTSKIELLGWRPSNDFSTNLRHTISWYMQNCQSEWATKKL